MTEWRPNYGAQLIIPLTLHTFKAHFDLIFVSWKEAEISWLSFCLMLVLLQ